MKKNNPIDSLFQQQLEDHQIQASDKVWEKIAAQQAGPNKRLAPIFYLRAASFALLIGLSALMYFNNNSESLMKLRMEREATSAPELAPKENLSNTATIKVDEPQKGEPKQTEPQPKPKKGSTSSPAEPAKKSTKKSRVIPVLKTYSPEPFLALNETEIPSAAILGMEETEPLKLEKSRVKIKVYLPEVKGYYGPDTTQTESAELGDRLWAYASNQLDRIVAGEKPNLPKTKSKISIPLPDFINRQFANSK